jgi:hypothetical protein
LLQVRNLSRPHVDTLLPRVSFLVAHCAPALSCAGVPDPLGSAATTSRFVATVENTAPPPSGSVGPGSSAATHNRVRLLGSRLHHESERFLSPASVERRIRACSMSSPYGAEGLAIAGADST